MSTNTAENALRAARLLAASDTLLTKLEQTLASLTGEKGDSQTLRQITACLKDVKDIQSLDASALTEISVTLGDAEPLAQ